MTLWISTMLSLSNLTYLRIFVHAIIRIHWRWIQQANVSSPSPLDNNIWSVGSERLYFSSWVCQLCTLRSQEGHLKFSPKHATCKLTEVLRGGGYNVIEKVNKDATKRCSFCWGLSNFLEDKLRVNWVKSEGEGDNLRTNMFEGMVGVGELYEIGFRRVKFCVMEHS